MIPVQNRARPHHVRPRLRPRANRPAVRQMHNPRLETPSARSRSTHHAKNFLLRHRLPANKIFRRREMRERPFQLQMRTFRQRPANASTSDGEIPSRFIPVFIFKWKRNCVMRAFRVR